MSEHAGVAEDYKPDDAPSQRVAPAEGLKRLQEGNRRYVAGESSARDYGAGRAERAAAQYPFAAILSCADSRVAPELAFDQGPGDLFVVRLAGNFVNNDGLASLEYAVEFLGVGTLVVMGHKNCGAVDAAIKVVQDDAELPGSLPCLIESIKPAVQALKRDGERVDLDRAIEENVRRNVHKLAKEDPIISPYVERGEIGVHGAVYDIASGEIRFIA